MPTMCLAQSFADQLASWLAFSGRLPAWQANMRPEPLTQKLAFPSLSTPLSPWTLGV